MFRGKENAGLPLLTPPRTHGPPHTGRTDAELFADGLNPNSPAEAAGRWEIRVGAPAASEDLDSSKAKSTGTWRGAPSCPRALLFLGELPAEAGMEADDESYPSPRAVPGCGAVEGPEMPCSPGWGEEAFAPAGAKC